MGLDKRAHELWLDGDNNPYETLTQQLEDEKRSREESVARAKADADVALAEEMESRTMLSWQPCENPGCSSSGTLQHVTMFLSEIAPVSEFQVGRWTCEICGADNDWSNS
jgi:hypothetical protein